MSIFGALDTSATGMTAQRLRTDLISQNIANVNTTRDANGRPYRRKTVVFAEKNLPTFDDALGMATGHSGKGVKATQIVEDHQTPERKVYDPAHPDADDQGYVYYPNVDVVTEMTNMIDASRSYEANITAFNATKGMAVKALEVGKG